jgi:hypothetical protein
LAYSHWLVKVEYTAEQLKTNRPEGLDPRRIHLYLSDSEFITVFKQDKATFAKLQQWKQDKLRKEAGLF